MHTLPNPMECLSAIQESLLRWFSRNKRALPWRESYAPYEVWISEIMLQQTQMERGVAYFTRWMERFPSIASLACAEESEVLRYWEGLGYYSRALNIHKAAKEIVARFQGVFPEKSEDIATLPGIGAYTSAAIASIAFEEPIACIDANVERVVSRLFNMEYAIESHEGKEAIRTYANHLFLPERARESNQAIMEFGALVCGKKPRCRECPLQDMCVSYARGVQMERPVKARKVQRTALEVFCAILVVQGEVLLEKRPNEGIWPNLWIFPSIEGVRDKEDFCAKLSHKTGLLLQEARDLSSLKHNYTRYNITLRVVEIELAQSLPLSPHSPYAWHSLSRLPHLALASPHRKIAALLTKNRLFQMLPLEDSAKKEKPIP